MRVRRLKIRGQNWRLIIGRPPKNMCDGVCELSTRTIYISPNRHVDREATVVHEILHASFPDMDEPAIIGAEQAIMVALRLISEMG